MIPALLLWFNLSYGQPSDEPLPVISGPDIVQYVEAEYPKEAFEQGLTAVVKLMISLDEEGEVESVEVVRPAGHGFDEAAVDAVLSMVFSPAQTEGGPVAVTFEFDYGFELGVEEVEEAPLPVTFEGLVVEMATRSPVKDAIIRVEGTDLFAQTSADGKFSIRGLQPGKWDVSIRSLAHGDQSREVEIIQGQVSTVRYWIKAKAYRDNELVAVYEPPKEEVTRRTITMDEIKRIPGTFGDPVKVIQTLPGAARSPFGTGLLVIRGANPEDSGVYIDGIRIPIIYHLTGTTSVIAPDLVQSVDYLPGGYGVQFGRTMGGTVDVQTKNAFDEEGKIIAGADILDSQVYFEGQLGKNNQHGLAVGARRSYIDVFLPLFTPATSFTIKPRYWDYQLKYVPTLSAQQSLSLFVYGFDDLLELHSPQEVAQGPDQDTQGDLHTQYNSHRLIGKYEYTPNEQFSLKVVPSIGVDGTDFGLGQDFLIKNTQYLFELRSQANIRPVPEVELVPGLDFIGGSFSFAFQSAINFEAFDDPLAEREPVGFEGNGSVFGPDMFLKVNLRPLKGEDKWLITPGIRANIVGTFVKGDITDEDSALWTTSIDPRILSRFAISENVGIKGSTGIYHQIPQPQELISIGTQEALAHERSWSSSVGIEHRISDSISWELEGFYRTMDRLIVFNNQWTGTGSAYTNGGQGRAYGLEFIARHDPVNHFFGWVSYTLSRSSRQDDGADPYCEEGEQDRFWGTGQCWYAFDFDQRHIFSAQGGYDLPWDLSVSTQIQYVTGNPADPFNAGVFDADSNSYNGFRVGSYNSDRLPPFFQTSVRVDKLWTFKRWQLSTYVDLLNAVRGVNPEFPLYNYDYSESAYVRGLPFIPNIGLEAKVHL